MNIDELKELQKKIIKRNKVCNTIGILLFLSISAIISFILWQKKIEIQFIIFSILFVGAVCAIIITIIKSIINSKNINRFNQEFKNIFVLNALKKNFENINYDEGQGFDEDFVENMNMLDTGDAFHSNDYIEGKYKNINFSQSDIHILEKHEEKDMDGDKKEVWKTIFLGRLMIFDFNKTFKANLQVISSYFYPRALTRKIKLNKVTLEDPEFNDEFTVLAENEHEAFYILTPHFMERIKELTNKLNCPIMFYFSNNKLNIAINNNDDSFEWDVLKPINEKIIEENITKDIKLITDFVDELNLDNDLFKKEV